MRLTRRCIYVFGEGAEFLPRDLKLSASLPDELGWPTKLAICVMEFVVDLNSDRSWGCRPWRCNQCRRVVISYGGYLCGFD